MVSLQKIDVVQRKMLREIVGWTRIHNEAWDVTMRRMNVRVTRALQKWPIIPWSTRIGKALWKMILRIKDAPIESWISETSMWEPTEVEDPYSEFYPYRNRGRTCLKWDTAVSNFCYLIHKESWQTLPVDVLRNSTDAFIAQFSSSWANLIPKPLVHSTRLPHTQRIDRVPFFRLGTETWW